MLKVYAGIISYKLRSRETVHQYMTKPESLFRER